jgi:two-component sensor histidine kinase
LLIAALDHQVKSLLTRVAEIVRDTGQSSNSVESHVRALDGRLQSMAGAHVLLSQNRWAGVDLAVLVRRQLAPSATDANATVDGPSVTLPVATAQALAMVLHELVTNAAKFGALSSPHGRVEVTWNRDTGNDNADLSIAWREIGGPAVPDSPDCRYGVGIIRELIPREIGGSVDLAFTPGGVCCKIEMPLEDARNQYAGDLQDPFGSEFRRHASPPLAGQPSSLN